MIRLVPKNPSAYNYRGLVYGKKGEYNKAVADFNEAIRLNPQYYFAYQNRGNIYDMDGKHDKALVDLDKAVRLNPREPAIYNDRGTVYFSKGDYDKALADFNEALRLDPKEAATYYNRGGLSDRKGAYDKAIADFNEAIQLNPRTAPERVARIIAFAGRGTSYEHKGNYEKAIADFNEAIRLGPKRPEGYNEFAWFLATCPRPALRDGRKAVEYATKACELSKWKTPVTIDTLAAAYAEVGDFDAAVKWEQRSLQTANPTQEEAAEYKSRLALYQAHKPYHQEKPHPPTREEKTISEAKL